jgi:hypothetical protein
MNRYITRITEMTTYIKFEVNQRTWSTGGYDPEDSWSRDSTDGTVDIVGAVKVEGDGYDILGIDKELTVGDVIYLVWAQYTTGDSFGRDGAQYELLEVFTNRVEAEKRRKYYEEAKDDGSYGEKGPYLSWFGYFENLDGVYVEGLALT